MGVNESKAEIKTIPVRPKEHTLVEYVFQNATENDPQSVLDAIDAFASKTFFMNVGPEKGAIVDEEIKKKNPSVMVELGAYLGYSAVRFSRLLPPDGRYFSFEISPVNAAFATKIIEFAGLSDKVKVIVGSFADKVDVLRTRYGVDTVDLFFIDHAKFAYLPDLKLIESKKLLAETSMVIADNVITPGAPDYLEYIRSNPNFDNKFVPTFLEYSNQQTPDGIEISTFKATA